MLVRSFDYFSLLLFIFLDEMKKPCWAWHPSWKKTLDFSFFFLPTSPSPWCVEKYFSVENIFRCCFISLLCRWNLHFVSLCWYEGMENGSCVLPSLNIYMKMSEGKFLSLRKMENFKQPSKTLVNEKKINATEQVFFLPLTQHSTSLLNKIWLKAPKALFFSSLDIISTSIRAENF